MGGRVLGKHFIDVVGQVLVHSEAEPAAVAREQAALAGIDPNAEQPWEAFTTTLARVSKTVRERLLTEVGQRIVRDAKPEFERWGFDTAEKMLADWDAPFGALIIDAPEEQMVLTLKYQPGQAFLRAGAVLPAALIEGYIRGVLDMFGADLVELGRHWVRMDGRPYHLFELRWRAAPIPHMVRHQTTERMVLGLAS
jgi:hypothetical protein